MSGIVSSGASVRLKRDPAEIRRRGLGIALFVLAGIILLLFARGTAGDARTTFLLTAAPAPPVPPIRLLVLPTVLVLGAFCAALGLLQLLWRSNRRSYLLLGIGLAVTGVAFLSWAGGAYRSTWKASSRLRSSRQCP